MARNSAKSHAGDERPMAELTVRAVLLGCVLSLLMTAANAYLGLYAGMTVSASIPAAVISMGILRGVLRRGTILENNIVQTIGSTGESLAAGIIFTVPALVITGVWDDYRFWPITSIAITGGLLGVLFMIPLRQALIVEEKELAYPEGTACAEVLKAGEAGGSGVTYVFGALAVGAVLKFLGTGVGLIRGSIEGAVRAGTSAFYFGCDVSPALMAVGFIVGFNIALLVFLGGAIAWFAGIPLYYLVRGFPAGSESVLEAMSGTWSSQIRYLGVGTMVVGGVWSILGVRRGIVRGLQGAMYGYRSGRHLVQRHRTERDISLVSIVGMLAATSILVFILYSILIGSVGFGLLAGVVMLVAAFFFVAVASYIVGLVGSSNSPVSGMTITTLLFASLMLLAFGLSGSAGILAVLGVAGVVCCAACTAGDTSQDLKTGYLVGASPYKQQWAQILSVLVSAFVLAPTLWALHHSYGIGMPAPSETSTSMKVLPADKAFLKAPQANLFASISLALFSDSQTNGGHSGAPARLPTIPWTMVIAGAGIGVAIIAMDEVLRRRGSRFRAYVMPMAVGIYLPWSLSTCIFLGGVAAALTRRVAGSRSAEDAFQRGVLVGSGLIAGEALMGIALAIPIILDMGIPKPSPPEAMKIAVSALVLAAVFVGMIVVSARRSLGGGT